MSFLVTVGTGVLVIVLGAAALALLRRARDPNEREDAADWFKQRSCRHRWEPINKPDDPVVLIAEEDEWCVRCGKRR